MIRIEIRCPTCNRLGVLTLDRDETLQVAEIDCIPCGGRIDVRWITAALRGFERAAEA